MDETCPPCTGGGGGGGGTGFAPRVPHGDGLHHDARRDRGAGRHDAAADERPAADARARAELAVLDDAARGERGAWQG